jgi:ribosomal protein S8E
MLNFVAAQSILSTDSSGEEKNLFYTNEIVYTKSTTNITTSSIQVRVYVITNKDNWSDGTPLTGYKTYISTMTDDAGYLPNTPIWNPPLIVGSYDIVVDVGNDGFYNSSIDLVDSLTTTGFVVNTTPKPSLSVALGQNTPKDHTWYPEINGSSHLNVMIQMNITAGSVEDVKITDVYLQASGTGNDKTGINTVELVWDTSGDGVFNQNEVFLSLNKYEKDDGFVDLKLNDFILPVNGSTNFIVIYKMDSDCCLNQETFSFQVNHVSAEGVNSHEVATINGLPINSAVKTIVTNRTNVTQPSQNITNVTTNQTVTNQTTNQTVVITNVTTNQTITNVTTPEAETPSEPDLVSKLIEFAKSSWFIFILVVVPVVVSVIILSRFKKRTEGFDVR